MSGRLFLLAALWLTAPMIRADEPVVHHEYQPPAADYAITSPDKKYFAATRTQPDSVLILRTDIDTGILVIIEDAPKSTHYVRYDMSRLCAQLRWSPDSRYLVLTTVSAGGHGPWHFDSFVYSIGDQSLRAMDKLIGLVVSPDFKFIGPHTLQMGIDPPDGDFDHPRQMPVDLDQKFPQMQKQDDRKEGELPVE